ncbi:prolyl aminopeptidase [Amycolatopsis sp. NPDC059657]|uniref:prolyl aminopeptidase n=1 Tax=Amycolatopsis sp. NPDC059657 TaxID=3346899 RepID=UPI00366F859C
MAELYPPIDPYDSGMLDVGDGNHVYWELCGNPDGKPAVVVHGGPGTGCSERMRQNFDPARYRVLLFDQRGSGRSTPHASDHTVDLSVNTTEHLLADMERLREHFGIDRWLVFGGSWGSTLGLAYAERHPERVSEMVICGVTTSRPAEIDWLYRGAGALFPEEWERFRDASAADDVLNGYVRLMADPDPEVRAKAADDWCAWEDTVLSFEPNGMPKPFGSMPQKQREAVVRICSHYFANDCFLEDGALLREAGRLKGIPAVLIHGRLDLSGPLHTAWELAKLWPEAELAVIEDSGHTGSDEMRARTRRALDDFVKAR